MCKNKNLEEKKKCHACNRKFPRKKMENCLGCGGYYCEDCMNWENGIYCLFCHNHNKYENSFFCDKCFNNIEYIKKPKECTGCDGLYCSKCKESHKCEPIYDYFIEEKRKLNYELIDACNKNDLKKIKQLLKENKDQKCGHCLYISLMDKNLDIAEFFLKKGTWLDSDSIRSILGELNSLEISYGKKVLDLFIKYDVDFENHIYVLDELEKYVLKILKIEWNKK